MIERGPELDYPTSCSLLQGSLYGASVDAKLKYIDKLWSFVATVHLKFKFFKFVGNLC